MTHAISSRFDVIHLHFSKLPTRPRGPGLILDRHQFLSSLLDLHIFTSLPLETNERRTKKKKNYTESSFTHLRVETRLCSFGPEFLSTKSKGRVPRIRDVLAGRNFVSLFFYPPGRHWREKRECSRLESRTFEVANVILSDKWNGPLVRRGWHMSGRAEKSRFCQSKREVLYGIATIRRINTLSRQLAYWNIFSRSKWAIARIVGLRWCRWCGDGRRDEDAIVAPFCHGFGERENHRPLVIIWIVDSTLFFPRSFSVMIASPSRQTRIAMGKTYFSSYWSFELT